MKINLKGHEINLKQVVLYTLITIIILMSIAIVSLRLYFNSQRLQKLVLPRLEKSIGRDLSIEDINLRFWPQLGVTIDKMKVANPEGFAPENTAQLDSFTLAVELIPLLQKKVEIEEIIISGLELDLIKKEDGTTNYQFSSKQSKSDSKHPPTDSESQSSAVNSKNNFKLDLENLALKNGQITYNDLAKQEKIEINGINSSNKLNIVGQSKKVSTAGNLEIKEIKLGDEKLDTLKQDKLNLALDHKLTFNGQQQILKAEKFDLTVNELDLHNSFEVELSPTGFQFKNLTTSSGDSILDIGVLTKSDSKIYFSLQGELYLASLMKKLPWEIKNQLEGQIRPDLMGQFDLDQLPDNLSSLELLGEINAADLAGSGDGMPGEFTHGAAQINIDPQRIELKSLQVDFLDSNFSGTGQIKSWRDMSEAMINKRDKIPGQINLALVVDQINLNQWQKNFAAVQSPTESEEESETQDLAQLIPDLPLEGTLEIGDLNYQNLTGTAVEAEVKSKNDLLQLTKFNLKTGEGEIGGTGELDLSSSKPRYKGDLKIEQMEVNSILSSLTKFDDKLYGVFNLDFDFNGSGLGVEQILESLSLQGDMIINDTILSAERIIEQLNSYFPVIDSSELNLGKLKGKIKLKDGKFNVNKVKTVSEGDKITLNGYSTLSGDLNFKVDYLLSAEKSEKMDLKHKELLYAPNTEQVQVALNLQGTTTKPQLKWDRSKLEDKLKEKAKEEIKEEADQKKEETKDKAKEKIEEKKDELKDKVKSLF